MHSNTALLIKLIKCTLLDGKCPDLGQGTGFQDGWRHPLPKIDGWHATCATRSNGGPVDDNTLIFCLQAQMKRNKDMETEITLTIFHKSHGGGNQQGGGGNQYRDFGLIRGV